MAEEIQTVNPHEEIINLIEKYGEIIRPSLEKGNLDGVRFLMKELCIRFGYFETSEGRRQAKRGTYARYRMAITDLAALSDETEVDKETLQRWIPYIDEQVSKLEILLGDDPRYKQMRGIEE